MKLNQMRFFVGLAVLSLALTATATAVEVAGLFNVGVPTLLSDNSAELLINRDGSSGPSGAPSVTSGDIIVTIAGISTIGPTTVGSGTLTGTSWALA